MFILISFALSLSLNAQEFAEPIPRPGPNPKLVASSSVGSVVELGGCVPEGKTGTAEPRVRGLAESNNLSRVDVLARLIFAESLSTGYWKGRCQFSSPDALMESIGWGIMNRVNKIKSAPDPYYDVVFAKGQFGTSFSAGTEERRNPFAKAFLCPHAASEYLSGASISAKAPELFEKARELAHRIIEEYSANGIPARYQRISNFFYPRSEWYGEMRPNWARNSDPTKNRGYLNLAGTTGNQAPCAEFYRL